jgi:hypothetical protein
VELRREVYGGSVLTAYRLQLFPFEQDKYPVAVSTPIPDEIQNAVTAPEKKTTLTEAAAKFTSTVEQILECGVNEMRTR